MTEPETGSYDLASQLMRRHQERLRVDRDTPCEMCGSPRGETLQPRCRPCQVRTARANYEAYCNRSWERATQAFGSPERYTGISLSTCLVDDGNRRAVEACRAAVETGVSLYLWGNVGCGKTYLGRALVHDILHRALARANTALDDIEEEDVLRCWVHARSDDTAPPLRQGGVLREQTFPVCRFVRESCLAGEVRSTYDNPGGNEATIMLRYETADVLMMDDLMAGTACSNAGSDFRQGLLDRLINARWEYQRQTIITANVSLADLAKRYGLARVASRILGMCDHDGIIHIGGRDRRATL